MKKYIRAAITVAVLSFAGWYVYAHRAVFAVIQTLDWSYVPLMLGVVAASIIINGLVLVVIVYRFGVRLRWTEWFGLTAIGSMGNYAPIPQAGPAARGLYLKKVHRFPLSTYTAAVLVVYVVALAIQGMVGLVELAIFGLAGMTPPWPLWMIFGACAAASLLLLPLPTVSISLPWIRKFQEGIQTLRNYRILAGISFLQLLQILVSSAGLWVAFAAIHQPTGFGTCLLLTAMVLCSGVFNVTPGNIGVAESAAWFTASLLGDDADLAVVAYTVHRAVSAATLFTLGPIFTILLAGRKKAGGQQRS